MLQLKAFMDSKASIHLAKRTSIRWVAISLLKNSKY